MTLDDFTRGYLTAALWTSDPDPGSGEWSEHDDWTIEHIDPADVASAADMGRQFLVDWQGALDAAIEHDPTYDHARAGHDLWLTRNGHGAGYWDRDIGDAGHVLTDAAEQLGSSDISRGDDGRLYLT